MIGVGLCRTVLFIWLINLLFLDHQIFSAESKKILYARGSQPKRLSQTQNFINNNNDSNNCQQTFYFDQNKNSFTNEYLNFCDDFNSFDLSIWKHDITMGGGGNWEFSYYTNNRTNSFTQNSTLYLKPTLTRDLIGNENVIGNNYYFDLWGSTSGDKCTGNEWYGCSRTSLAGGNILNPVQSALIRSNKAFSFKFGRLEVRAKLPKGDWIWPAIWLLPVHNEYGNWPASGEIDIMESRGNANNYPDGLNSFGSTLHFGPSWQLDPYPLTHATYKLSEGLLSDDFHIFGLKWNETSMMTYIDNESNPVLSVPITESFWDKVKSFSPNAANSYNNPWNKTGSINAPFDQEFYIIMNVAVGGTTTYWPDGVGGKPWTNSDSHAVNSFYNSVNTWLPTWNLDSNTHDNAMKIDWIKVYESTPPTSSPTAPTTISPTGPSTIKPTSNGPLIPTTQSNPTSPSNSNNNNNAITPTAVGLIITLVVLVLLIISFCVWRQKQKRGENTDLDDKLLEPGSSQMDPIRSQTD